MAASVTWISLLGLVLVIGRGRLAETLEICKLTFFFHLLHFTAASYFWNRCNLISRFWQIKKLGPGYLTTAIDFLV